jgi:predicted nucleic acid-binding protein
MSYLLDTNICSAHMKRPAGLMHRFVQHSGRLAIPSLVLAELYAGAYLLSDPAAMIRRIESLLTDVQVIDFDAAAAHVFGRLRGAFGLAASPWRRST